MIPQINFNSEAFFVKINSDARQLLPLRSTHTHTQNTHTHTNTHITHTHTHNYAVLQLDEGTQIQTGRQTDTHTHTRARTDIYTSVFIRQTDTQWCMGLPERPECWVCCELVRVCVCALLSVAWGNYDSLLLAAPDLLTRAFVCLLAHQSTTVQCTRVLRPRSATTMNDLSSLSRADCTWEYLCCINAHEHVN